MKLLLTYLLGCLVLFGQAQHQEPVQIQIIGTIHTGNRHFNHKELYLELEKLRPDIILWEQSDTFRIVTGLRTAAFLRIWKPGIEQLALQKYLKKYDHCLILPFDSAFDRKQYKTDLIKNKEYLHYQLDRIGKQKEDSIAWQSYQAERSAYYEGLNNMKLEQINSEGSIQKGRSLQKLEEKIVLPLAKQYCPDSSLVQWYKSELTFSDLRNKCLARNIESTALKYPGRKIIVLTGLSHKHHLLDLLMMNNGKGFVLVPYGD